MCNPIKDIFKGVSQIFGAMLGIPKEQSQTGGMVPTSLMPPAIAAPVAPPAAQAAQQPDQEAVRGASAGRARGAAAPASTMLTGPGGVAPGALNVGKNTLLGM